MTALYDKLQLVVKYNISPDDMNNLTEEKPVIDTVNENDRNALLMANINIADASSITAEQLKNARRVMYWKTGATVHAVNIMGVAWLADKVIRIFKAQVLSP